MKALICSIGGGVTSFILYLLGGWSHDIQTLVIFMGIDFLLGLIVAGIFHKSSKTKSGALESRAGFKGLAKKVTVLLFVVIGNRLDVEVGTDYFRTAICIAFMINELISIIENAGLMGIPIPKILTKAIDVLNEKGDVTHV